MVAIDAFVGLDSATLSELKTAYTSCLVAIASAGQSYTISGRQFTRADLSTVTETIAALSYAQNQLTNTRATRTVAGFGSPYA